MRIHRKLLALALLICLLPGLAARGQAAESVQPYIQRMIRYYLEDQEKAMPQIGVLLGHIASLDEDQGALWETIMADWDHYSREMTVNADFLSEDLPEDDSLCILVLGYDLSVNGTAKPELVGRLLTALRAAEKYPNAYVLVTGGDTAEAVETTEAEEMAAFLRANGISQDRIILETEAMSTTGNARNAYRLLNAQYPSVTQVAVITSDYHMRQGCVLFQTVSNWEAARGGRAIDVVDNAAWVTDKTSNTLESEARGISRITGIPFENTETEKG